MKPFLWSFTLILLHGTAFADSPKKFDWPQWQGPDRTAISKEQRTSQAMARRRPVTGLGGQGTGRRLQRTLHRRRTGSWYGQSRQR